MSNFKEVTAADILRKVHFSLNISIEEIAKRCLISEKEVKNIIKKGTHPIFSVKMKIISEFKDDYEKQ